MRPQNVVHLYAVDTGFLVVNRQTGGLVPLLTEGILSHITHRLLFLSKKEGERDRGRERERDRERERVRERE